MESAFRASVLSLRALFVSESRKNALLVASFEPLVALFEPLFARLGALLKGTVCSRVESRKVKEGRRGSSGG